MWESLWETNNYISHILLPNTTNGPKLQSTMHDDDNDNDSSTTLGHGLLDEDSSHASSDLLGLTPLKGRKSPESFISPATQTLNVLSQQDTNNLRYDFGQMENDAAAVSSQQSPVSLDITPGPKTRPRSRKRLTSPLESNKFCKESSKQVSWRNTNNSNSKPSSVAPQFPDAEEQTSTHLTPLNSYSRSKVITNESRKDNSTVAASQSILISNTTRKSFPPPPPPPPPTTTTIASTTDIITDSPMIDLIHADEIERLNKLQVHTIVFSKPGPLGMTIQHVDVAGLELCRVKDISTESQGYGRAQQGDLFCTSSSSNHCKQWLTRSQMLELATEGSRPLTVCLARMEDTDKVSSVIVATSDTDTATAVYSQTTLTKAALMDQTFLSTVGATAAERCLSSKLLTPCTTTCESGITGDDIKVNKNRSPANFFVGQNKIILGKTSSKEMLVTYQKLDSSAEAVDVPCATPTSSVFTHDKQGPVPSEGRPKGSYFCQRCTGNGDTAKHHNLCHLYPTNDTITREMRLQRLQCGTDIDCRACKFELEHGWGANKRYVHCCTRSRKVVKTNLNGTNATQTKGIPLSTLITIPYCLGCKNASEDHVERCPQHPAFKTSGAKDILKTIYRGVQEGCENCLEEFNTGKTVTYLRHSTKCPRRSAFSGRQQSTRNKISRDGSGATNPMLDGKSSTVKKPTESAKPSRTDLPTKLGCCSACHSGSTKRHRELCPQHPTFATSGAKIRFERICLGMQAGCQVCRNEFEQGKRIGTTRHAVQCIRRFGKNALDVETEMKRKNKKNDTISMAELTRERDDYAIKARKACLMEKSTGDDRLKKSENIEKSPTNPSLSCVKKGISVGNKCTNKDVNPLGSSGEERFGSEKSVTVGTSTIRFDFPLNAGFEKADKVSTSLIIDELSIPILRLDESIQIENVKVPFCFACRAKSKIHNALCPKHPQFSTSGAPEKLELLRRGLNLGCHACIFHFNKGYPDKSCEHSDGCECKQVNRKEEGKASTLVAMDLRKNTSHHSSNVKNDKSQMPVRNDELIDSNLVKSLVTQSIQKEVFLSTTSGRKVKISEKGKTAEIELSDTGSLASENSSRKPKKGSQQMISLLGPATAPSFEANKAKTRKKSPTLISRPFDVPVLCKKKETIQASKDDTRTASEIPGSNTTVKQRWIKATNPWGSYEYQDGDVVLALPIDGFTSHEVAFSGTRFIEKPFAPNSVYMETHVLPEDGVLLLQLARDRLSLTPWGFMFSSHEFGGACLVTSVDPLSPASNACVHGSTTKVALNVHDIILSINGLNVGGMTELGLEIELEVSGPDILVAVARYRFASVDLQNAAAKENASLKVLDEIQGDKKVLGWHEFALIEDSESRIPSRLLPPSTGEDDAVIADPDLDDKSPSTNFCLTTFDRVSDITLQCIGKNVVENNGIAKNHARMIASENKMVFETEPKEHSRIQQQKITFIEQSECLVVDTNEEMRVSLNPLHDLGTCGTHYSAPQFREGKPLEAVATRNDVESETEYDDDDNPWSGCVCGIIHELPIPVFWIQCDQCDAWFNVWESCVGVSEEGAAHLSRFLCWSCHPPDILTDGNRSELSVTLDTSPVLTVSEYENGGNTKSDDSCAMLNSKTKNPVRTFVQTASRSTLTSVSLLEVHKSRKIECLRLPSHESSKKAKRRV